MFFTPLFLGIHNSILTDEGTFLSHHTSAVSLVQSDGKNILIDCGSRGAFPLLKEKLSEYNITPNDIDILILTHFHLDHAFNMALFQNAQIIGWSHKWEKTGTLRIQNLQDLEIATGVNIFPTPGHAEEHLAVEITNDKGEKIIIAGDAIDKHYVDTKEINRFAYDKKLYQESADEIIRRANYIIPGHGEIITL